VAYPAAPQPRINPRASAQEPRLLPELLLNAHSGSRLPGFGRRLGCFILGRLDEQVGDLLSPIQNPCSRNHDHDAGGANDQLLPDTPVYCIRIQCAPKDRNTPKQKIGSEC
jgi:hypothetical protein